MAEDESERATDRRVRAAEILVKTGNLMSGECGQGSPSTSASACPNAQGDQNSANNMPKIQNESTKASLSSHRQVSTIPIGPTDLPNHQEKDAKRWTYPSPQMFFNAMKRKGWKPKEEDMEVVVAIHNTVNERVWEHILHWEELHKSECCEPQLSRFEGRPKDYSPRARMLNWLGYKLPFDRHDWVVDRCGEKVRYVIDFYNAPPSGPEPVAMHLDVRPALDSFGACYDRFRMFAYQALGLAGSSAAQDSSGGGLKEQQQNQ